MKIIKILTLILCSFVCRSADFERFFPHVIQVEGVLFTVTQYDRGGATKFGVTFSVYKTWCNGKQIEIPPCDKDGNGRLTANDLRLTVLQDVKPIYRQNYWNLCKADNITNQEVAELLVDMIIHCGVGFNAQHIKAFQRIVGANQDGKVGPLTLQATNKGNSRKIYNELSKYRKSFYKKLTLRRPTQKKFLRGWYNRLSILKQIHYGNEKIASNGSIGVEPIACVLMQHNDSRTPQRFSLERKTACFVDLQGGQDSCTNFGQPQCFDS
jgi:lysozyme family protein